MEDATSRVWDCNRVTRGYGVDVRLVLVHDAGVEAVGVCGRGGALFLFFPLSAVKSISNICVSSSSRASEGR